MCIRDSFPTSPQPILPVVNGDCITIDLSGISGAVYYRLLVTGDDGCNEGTAKVERNFLIAPCRQQNIAQLENFSVSPNPANDYFQLQYEITQPTLAQLHSPSGKIVLQQNLLPGSQQTRFATAHLPHGIYLLSIHSKDKGIIRQKIAIQR